jgi:hypothetical protein
MYSHLPPHAHTAHDKLLTLARRRVPITFEKSRMRRFID